MDRLTLFVVIPALTIIGILFTKNYKQARLVSAIGMSFQVINAAHLIITYLAARTTGNMNEMLFYFDTMW